MTPEELAESLAKPECLISDEARAFVKRCVELRRDGRKVSAASALKALIEHYGWPYATTNTLKAYAEREFGSW